jgi:putative transcriptional regulator
LEEKVSTFDRVMKGLNEALDHAKGNDVPGMRVHVPAVLDVSQIRRRTGLSQPAFANTIGVQVGTLRNWEQGRRAPEGAARVLLAMLDRNPRIVADVLGGPEGARGVERTGTGGMVATPGTTRAKRRA